MQKIEQYKIGENFLILRGWVQSDGTTAEDVTAFENFTATILQNGAVIETLSFISSATVTAGNFRKGSTTADTVIEITRAISAALSEGAVTVRYQYDAVNANYGEGYQRDIIIPEETVAIMRAA